MKLRYAFVLLVLLGCRDYEQSARATGAAARADIATRCAAEAKTSDAGPQFEDSCADEQCRVACSTNVAKGFSGTCIAECRQIAICATDADCMKGMKCVAIAPRVRRCSPPPLPVP